ncbi:hypothetical protein PR202_gb21574 [Eleusine coracana subsp. coracana]|uniref:Uncharacterized protein n=1 Tax=Eleusine coracana subsp. coracana TaxID=191504 RepID=A0AAV5FDR9_ELECO|nr:hypothetical protein PR202_gb21574 [Eleusine coracana subsp. coracana]
MALARAVALGLAVVAACACLVCPAAALVEMMTAPGSGGAFTISRAAFEANPQLCFRLLRHSGIEAAVESFGDQSTENGPPLIVAALVLRTVIGAACAYFFWPAAMMKAPGAAGLLISRAAFLANPQLYFELLRPERWGAGRGGRVHGLIDHAAAMTIQAPRQVVEAFGSSSSPAH